MRSSLLSVIFLVYASVGLAHAQTIVQSRGADPLRINYAEFARYSPWDDRNYNLTRADLTELARLSPNDTRLYDPVPVFFRLQLRKNWPELQNATSYPRSALQIFQLYYGGYQTGGQVSLRAEFNAGRYIVAAPRPEERLQRAGPKRLQLGEVRVTIPEGAAESAIKANPTTPDLLIAGSNGPGLGQKMHFSNDGGKTWKETSLPLGGTCCDPTVEWSSDGKLAYAATLGGCTFSGCGVWFYRSSDQGQTWTDLQNETPGDPRRELTLRGSDKEYLHVDKHPTSPHRDNIYLTWHEANVMKFSRSSDRGNVWTPAASFDSEPRGIGSDITTDTNGHVYYFWAATNDRRIVMKKSTDGGTTWAAGVKVADTNGSFDFPIPAMEARRAWIYVSADADISTGPFGGRIYAAWTDTTAAEDELNPQSNHTRIHVAHSTDGGASWVVVTPHETTDQDKVDRFNQWLAVAPNGWVHVIFYDTRHDATRESVDLYHSVSKDGAVTFSPPQRLTTESSHNITDAFEFGDYNGLDAFLDKFIAVYTDNRPEAAGTGNSVDVYAVGSESARGIQERSARP
jgi:hypothetical protein